MENDDSFVSMKHGVEFPNLFDQYATDENIVIEYVIVNHQRKDGDRIAIFKLGWTSVKDYVVFEWVTVAKEQVGTVVFKKENLPKNSADMYQVCYIGAENELHGASSPFQLGLKNNSTFSSMADSTKSTVFLMNKSKDDEISQLKEENQLLKNTLKMILQQSKMLDDYQNIKLALGKVEDVCRAQQEEINSIKQKIVAGGEEYKKLYLEKAKIEKSYESLKKHHEEKIINVSKDPNFIIGDFKSIPPFPIT